MEIAKISADLRQHHYWHGRDFSQLIHVDIDEQQSFRSYWDNLVQDEAFKGYTHRERRILRYHLLPSLELEIDKNCTYKSSVVYPITYRQGVNTLSYSEEGFIAHPVLRQLLEVDLATISSCLGENTYSVDIHQFRVKADSQTVSPTTSGIHQDGLDWVFMHFINAFNTSPVVSHVYANQEPESCLLSVPMERFLETIVINDCKVYHSASDVRQVAGEFPAWRDLLLVGVRRVPGDEAFSS